MVKKGYIRLLFSIVLVILLLPSLQVKASNGYLDASAFDIAVDIQQNGDARVVERITFRFDGSFNGVLRDIDYSRTSGIEDVKVQLDNNNVLTDYTEGYAGENGTYEKVDTGSLIKLKIYEKSRNEEKTVVVSYTLKNVAEKYNDIGIFNRKIVDSGWQITLNNINITITIPSGATKDQLKVFAHGPLTGVSEIVDERTFKFSVPSVNGQFVETLVIFPPELISASTNVFNNNQLPTILENEGKLADEANRQREEAQKILEAEQKRKELGQSLLPLFLGGIAAGIGSILFMVKKYTTGLKPEFFGDYYRELPGDYSPAVMSYLLSKGKTKDDDIMATIMDLARKKVIKLSPVEFESGTIFKKTEETFKITWLNEEKKELLLPHEKFLADWFINDIGGGTELILEDLETIVKKKKAALQFQNDYNYFKALVKDTAESKEFFTANVIKGAGAFVLLGFAFIALGLIGAFWLRSIPAFGLVILGGAMLLILLVVNFIRMLTRYGTEQTAMWKAFKKFLLDFSNLKDAEIPSLVIWEHYLVYATSLGIAKEVIDQLPKVFTDAELSNPDLTYMGGYRNFNSIYFMNNAFSNTMSKVSSAVSSAQIANSTKSSGGGFGGGFSGGSSGGGGGGGGGGGF